MIRGLVRLPLVGLLLLVTQADAAVLCQKHSGAVFVRDVCRKKETAVEPRTLGLVTEDDGGRLRAYGCSDASADGTLVAPCPNRPGKNVTISTSVAPNATCFNLDPSIEVTSAVPVVALGNTHRPSGVPASGVDAIVSVINGGFAVCGPNSITVFTGRYSVTEGVETFTPVRLPLTLVVF